MPFDDNEQTSSKNFIIAMVLFMAIMFGYEYFADSKKSDQAEVQKTEQVENSPENDEEDKDDESQNVSRETLSVDDALNRSSRISLENDHVVGSIDLDGGIIDSIVLKDYKETVEPDSKNIMLLAPKDTAKQFYYAISYNDKTNKEIISDSTVWTSEDLSGKSQTINLKTQTQNGLIIERTITLDDGYYIKIKDKVLNVSSKKIKLQPRSELVNSNPELHNYAIVHEGLVGCSSGGKVEEIKYKKISSKKKSLEGDGGWLGYTDLYWLCAITSDFGNLNYEKDDEDAYKISTHSKSVSLEPDSMKEFNYSIYAGPKDIKLLKNYRDNEGLEKFEMAIDFG